MISIIIPLFNKEKSIQATLESVCAQTYTDFEVLVVNDGSSDKGADIATKYPDARICVINKENGGVCSARNRGIEEATGEYVAFLDADDIWDKDYLAEQVKMIRDFPEAAMWGINFAEMKDCKLVRKLETSLPDGYRGYVENYFQMPGRISDLYCSSSVVIRRDVFDEVGAFDERVRYGEDNDMWWRIIATHKVAFNDDYKVYYVLDAQNRALSKPHRLIYDVEYYVDKFQAPMFKQNKVFYRWVNQRSAQWIARVLFTSPEDRKDAYIAAAKLDYREIKMKYWFFFHMPYGIAKWLYLTILRVKSKNK